jgi:histidinol-phosphate phosphatase family protein
MGKRRKIIFFDRDGVLTPSIEINKVPIPTYRIGHLLDKSIAKQICQMKIQSSDYFFSMVTNQPDIARGARRIEELNYENLEICNFYKIDDWEMCPHDKVDNCSCRKPKVGLVKKILKRNNIQNNFIHSYVIGDRIADIELAKNIQATPLFIDHKYYENRNFNYECKKKK